MSKTYLFSGASSAIAIASKTILQNNGHKVIGISTKADNHGYDDFYQINEYDFGQFPVIEQAIDGIVYFPGTINLKPFHRFKGEEFTTDFSINTLGAAAFAQAYLNNLKKVSQSSIVFISSVAVGLGLPFHASIAMAKGAIEGLTRALASEYAPSIRVNCVAPSLVNTPMGEKLLSTPEKFQLMEKRNPLQKVGDPIDVANAIVFLLGEQSHWVSGQVFGIDGGMSTIKNG